MKYSLHRKLFEDPGSDMPTVEIPDNAIVLGKTWYGGKFYLDYLLPEVDKKSD